MGDPAPGLPEIVEAGMKAVSYRARAVSMAAGAAAIRQAAKGETADEEHVRRLRAEADAIFDQAFAPLSAGDFGRLRALLVLGALTSRSGPGGAGVGP